MRERLAGESACSTGAGIQPDKPQLFSCSWKYQIDLAPIFLRGGALGGPVRRVVQLIGNLRRPETALMAIEYVALHRSTQAGRAAVVIRLPPRRKDHRTAQRNMRLPRRRGR